MPKSVNTNNCFACGIHNDYVNIVLIICLSASGHVQYIIDVQMMRLLVCSLRVRFLFFLSRESGSIVIVVIVKCYYL